MSSFSAVDDRGAEPRHLFRRHKEEVHDHTHRLQSSFRPPAAETQRTDRRELWATSCPCKHLKACHRHRRSQFHESSVIQSVSDPCVCPGAAAIYKPQSCRDTHTVTELQLGELLCRYELLIITVTLMGS